MVMLSISNTFDASNFDDGAGKERKEKLSQYSLSTFCIDVSSSESKSNLIKTTLSSEAFLKSFFDEKFFEFICKTKARRRASLSDSRLQKQIA